MGRTFIQPSQTIRQPGIRPKLNPLKEVIRGKRLIVVDDLDRAGKHQRAPRGCSGRQGRSRSTAHRPPLRQWLCFTASISPRRPNLIANAAGRGRNARCRPQRHRCRQPRDTSSAGHDRRHRAAGQPPKAAHASTAITRSNCPAKRCSARTSSNTCWQPPRALTPICPLSKRMAAGCRFRPTTTTSRRCAGRRTRTRSRVRHVDGQLAARRVDVEDPQHQGLVPSLRPRGCTWDHCARKSPGRLVDPVDGAVLFVVRQRPGADYAENLTGVIVPARAAAGSDGQLFGDSPCPL